jgi:hypothetical protein
MIADTNRWAAVARRVAGLDGRGAGGSGGPGPATVTAALRALVWLAGERVAVPQGAGAGRGHTIVLTWGQDGSRFRVEILDAGRLVWQAEDADGAGWSGSRLNRQAADLLRSLIPLARGGRRTARPTG